MQFQGEHINYGMHAKKQLTVTKYGSVDFHVLKMTKVRQS